MSDEFDRFLTNLEFDERLARLRGECQEHIVTGVPMEIDPRDMLMLVNSLSNIQRISERQNEHFKKLAKVFEDLINEINSE